MIGEQINVNGGQVRLGFRLLTAGS